MLNTTYRTLDWLPDIAGRRVLVRVDFNVPVEASTGRITDDTRIVGALPTLEWLLERGARVIVMSHRGRPKGSDPAFSLEPVARYLGGRLGWPVKFVADIAGPEAEEASRALKPGEVLVLENLRFDPKEKSNDPDFSDRLAGLADFYVNDAFGTAHRSHSSIVGVPQRLPGCAGRLMERELAALDGVLGHPDRPYWAIIGGAKVSDKVLLLDRLLDRVDGLVIGGGMANTFLVASGYQMGVSKVESEAVETARALIAKAKARHIRLVLPSDLVVTRAFSETAPFRVTSPDQVGEDEMALDVGPDTVRRVTDELKAARTVLWNGPMGVFEWDNFAQGTMNIARALAELDAKVVVGGGDSVAAVHKAGVKDRLTHVSTGGGAALEFLEGKVLPGIEVLTGEPEGGR